MASKWIGRFDDSMLENTDEFDKRYRDTFLFVRVESLGKMLMYCRGTDSGKVVFNNDTLGEISLTSMTDVEVTSEYPERGLFQFGKECLLIQKIPDRQWKRGPCSKNMQIRSPVRALVDKYPLLPVTMEVMESSYRGRDTVLRLLDTINMFKKGGCISVRLNNDWFISLPPKNSQSYVLWYRNNPCSTVIPGKRILVSKNPYLKQELLDFAKYHEENTWTVTEITP